MESEHCPAPGLHLAHSSTQTDGPACCGVLVYTLVQELAWTKSELQQACLGRPDATDSSHLATSLTRDCLDPTIVPGGLLPPWGSEFRAEPQPQAEPQHLKQELVGPDVVEPHPLLSLDVGFGRHSVAAQAGDVPMELASSSPIISTAPDFNINADPTEAVPPELNGLAHFDVKLEPLSLDPATLLTTKQSLQDSAEYAEPCKGELDIVEWEALPEEDTHEESDATVSSQLADRPTTGCVVSTMVTESRLPPCESEFRAEPQPQTESEDLKQELVGPDVIEPSPPLSLKERSRAPSFAAQAKDFTLQPASSSPIVSTAPDFTANPTEAVFTELNELALLDVNVEPPSLDLALEDPPLLTRTLPMQEVDDVANETEETLQLPQHVEEGDAPQHTVHDSSIHRSGSEESTSRTVKRQHRRRTPRLPPEPSHRRLRGCTESTAAGSSNQGTESQRKAGAFEVPSGRALPQPLRRPANDRPSAIPGQKKLQSGSSSHRCSRCGKVFSRQSSLQQHQLTHTGERPHGCTECGRRFSQLTNLQTHRRTVHAGERPHCCHQCGKAFGVLSSLEKHIRTHTGERPFSCQYCERSFSRKFTLETHLRTHTNERPFSCQYCQRSFSQKSSLKIHIRTHTAERPYTCEQCEKSFSDQSNLIRHRVTHTKIWAFECDHCKQTFKWKNVLKRHLKQHIAH